MCVWFHLGSHHRPCRAGWLHHRPTWTARLVDCTCGEHCYYSSTLDWFTFWLLVKTPYTVSARYYIGCGEHRYYSTSSTLDWFTFDHLRHPLCSICKILYRVWRTWLLFYLQHTWLVHLLTPCENTLYSICKILYRVWRTLLLFYLQHTWLVHLLIPCKTTLYSGWFHLLGRFSWIKFGED